MLTDNNQISIYADGITYAYIERLYSGEWFWKVSSLRLDVDCMGNEPTKQFAIKAANDELSKLESKTGA